MNKLLTGLVLATAMLLFAGQAGADEIGSFEFTGGSLAFTDADAGDGITVSDLNANSYAGLLFDGADNDSIRIDTAEAPNGTGSAFKFGLYLSFDITNNTGADLELGRFTIDYRGENITDQMQARVYNAFPIDIVADTISRLGKPNGGTDAEFVNDDAILDGTASDSGANFFGVPIVIADGATATFFLPFNNPADDAASWVDMDNLTICTTVPEPPGPPPANLLATFEFTAGSLSPTDADAGDGVTVSDLNINSYSASQLFDSDDPDQIRLDGLETQASTANAFKFGELFSFDVTNNSGSDLAMDSLRIEYRGTNVFQNFAARVFTAPPIDVVADTIGRLGKEDAGSDPFFELDIAFLDGTDPGAGANTTGVPTIIPDGATFTFFLPFTMNSNSDTRFMDLDNLTVNSSLAPKCTPGDVNMDGQINLLDVGPFVDAVSNGTFLCEADVNEDGNVDLLDVGPFVLLLSGG